MKMNKTRKLNIIILIVVSGIVLYFILKDDFFKVLDSLTKVNLFWVLISLLLIFLYWFFSALAFNNIAKRFKKNMKLKQSLKINVITQFFNGVTPFATGGQPSQVYYLKKEGITIPVGTSICLQAFLVYQIDLIILGIVAIISNNYFDLFKEVTIMKTLVALGFLFNVVVLVLIFLVSFNKKANKFLLVQVLNFLNKIKIIKNRDHTREKWDRYLETFSNSANSIFKNKLQFFKILGYNTVALTCMYSIPLILMFSVGDYTSINLIESFTATAYVMIVGSFIPIPGAAGGIEYAFISLFGNFTGGPALKILLLLWRFVTYYFGLFLGAIVINVFEDKRLRK